MMILITGGSASGKSAFAEDKLLSFGDKKRYYLATMAVWDEECRERIRSINAFERQLTDNGYLVVKFFLHIPAFNKQIPQR